MRLLDKYVLKEFGRFFALTCASFIVLYLIVDFFEKIRMFLSNSATASQMLSYFLFSVPLIISLTLPAAMLLASLMTFSSFSKFGEITAMKANGISLYRLSMPVLIFASVVAVFLFYFSELFTPAATQKAERIILVDVQKQKPLGFFKQDEIWYRSDNAIYNFKIFDVNSNTLKSITINYINSDYTLKMRADAEEARWEAGRWIFYNLLITSFDDKGSPLLERFKRKIIDLPEKPDDFKIMQKDAEKMGFFDLRKYVKKIQKEGYDAVRYEVDLHGKLAFPLVTVILVIIGICFSLKQERHGGLLQNVGIAIAVGFSYWIIHAFCLSLGRSGLLPAVVSAWAANILFMAFALALFFRARS